MGKEQVSRPPGGAARGGVPAQPGVHWVSQADNEGWALIHSAHFTLQEDSTDG